MTLFFSLLQVPGIDDVTGEPLIKRADDNAETLKTRLRTYHEQTAPLIHFYDDRNLYKSVDASQAANKVFEDIKGMFRRVKDVDAKIKARASL